MVSGDGSSLTIVIPTFNERPNVERLLEEFAALRYGWTESFGIILVDDASPDGTALAAIQLARDLDLPLEVLSRTGRRGHGVAVADGLRWSTAAFVCVMDGDLSHPPSLLPLLFERLNGFDGVVASRYVAGASIVEWPRTRRLISIVATALARPLLQTACADPLSGYFLFRREALLDIDVSGLGNKPLLEILVKKELTVLDVPYEFRDREGGKSKLGLRGIFGYARMLIALWIMQRKGGERWTTRKERFDRTARESRAVK